MEIDNGKKYNEALKIHAEIVETMIGVGYGLLKDGDTFYRLGMELEPRNGITFTMREAYEIHRFLSTLLTSEAQKREEDKLKSLILACGSKFQSLSLVPDGQLVDAKTGKSIGERWYAYTTDEVYHNELGGDCVNDCCGQFTGETPEEAVEALLHTLTIPTSREAK